MRAQFLPDERAIESAEPHELAAIVGELARRLALALASIVTPVETYKIAEPEPKLLSVSEAAALVSLTPIVLRRSAKFRPARRKLGTRTIRWDRDALVRIARRAA